MEKEELIKLLPRLIREDDEIKGAIITALSGVIATKEDIKDVIHEFNKRFETMDKRFETMDKRFETMDKRFEKMDKRFEKMDKRFEKMDERFEKMDKRFEKMDERFETLIQKMEQGFEEARQDRLDLRRFIETKSSQGGLYLQELVLNLLNDQLIQENIERSNITREYLFDKSGEVYAANYSTDIDLVVQDGKTFLMEVKSIADNRDAYDLTQKGRLFKIQFGKDYDGLILACLEINRINYEFAKNLGIRVIAGKIT